MISYCLVISIHLFDRCFRTTLTRLPLVRQNKRVHVCAPKCDPTPNLKLTAKTEPMRVWHRLLGALISISAHKWCTNTHKAVSVSKTITCHTHGCVCVCVMMRTCFGGDAFSSHKYHPSHTFALSRWMTWVQRDVRIQLFDKSNLFDPCWLCTINRGAIDFRGTDKRIWKVDLV